MSEARSSLLKALQRVADGGDLTSDELDAAIPDLEGLDPAESQAWHQLSHWVDDEDIRAKDAEYAAYQRDRIKRHFAALSGFLPEEIDRGEHDAWHVPLWGCAGVILIVAGGVFLLT